MKKSKSTQSESKIDLISNLPDPVLHLILSGIPTTEEVVRTSILSTRWRYLWTSIPSVNIDYKRKLGQNQNFDVDKFKEFVYWVLLNKTLDLDSFHLCCRNRFNLSTVCRWIHAAVMRKVKSIDLRFLPIDENETIVLPHSLVTCDSLEALHLFLYYHPLTLPTVTGFSALRVLKLEKIDLPDTDSLKIFLKTCPLLEDLRLIQLIFKSFGVLCISCLNLKTLVIDNRGLGHDLYGYQGMCQGLNISCPKLVHLEYAGWVAGGFSFENLNTLKEAMIYPQMVHGFDMGMLCEAMCKLFTLVSHVESLSVNHFFIECISNAVELYCDLPASLHNMKTLEISVDIQECTIFVVADDILKRCPNLESVHLSILQGVSNCFVPHVIKKLPIKLPISGPESQEIAWENEAQRHRLASKLRLGAQSERFSQGISWEEEWGLDEALALHLKRVEFVDFMSEGKQNLELVQFLLEHGNELEEVVFSWRYKEIYDTESKKTLERVSSFKRASSTVKLVTLLKAR